MVKKTKRVHIGDAERESAKKIAAEVYYATTDKRSQKSPESPLKSLR
jgi:hypothetical protein